MPLRACEPALYHCAIFFVIEVNKALAARGAAGATTGLAAGLLASFAMNAFQRLLSAPNEPDELPATVVAADRIFVTITGRQLAERHHKVAGEVVHYSLGAVLGIFYGGLRNSIPRSRRGPACRSGSARR